MHRYAVLHSLDGDNLPIGLAIERRGYVLIETMHERAPLPARIEEEYRVRQRDLSEVIYRPGDDHYFDQVLIELARVCSIGKQGAVIDADWGTIISLLRTHVIGPRVGALRGDYAHAVGRTVIKGQAYATPVYRARQDRRYMIHGASVSHPTDEPPVVTPTRGRNRVAA